MILSIVGNTLILNVVIVCLQCTFEQNISEEIRPPTPLIMFAATGPSTVVSNQPLIFSSVFENFGDGYNAATGLFTTPFKGLYIFSLSMCTHLNIDARFGIKSDGSIIVSTRVIDEKRHSCGTIVTPVVLTKGQQVHAECVQNCKVTVLYGNSTNLFAGSLIRTLD